MDIFQGFVVLDDCRNFVDWFDTEEEAERFVEEREQELESE